MDDSEFDKLIGEVELFLKEEALPPPPTEKTRYAIVHDTFDEMTWESALRKSPSLLRMVKGITGDFPLTGSALEDFFNLYFQTDPRMTDVERVLKEHLLSYTLVEGLFDSEEIRQLRKHTALNQFASTEALEDMEDAIRELLEMLQAALDALSAAMAAFQQALQDLADAGRDARNAPGDGGAQEALQEALDAAKAAKVILDETEAAGEQATADALDAAKDAAQKAGDKLENDQQTSQTFGLDDGQARRMDYAARKQLAERLRQDKIQRITNLLGAFKHVRRAARRDRVRNEPHETYDYVLGDDLTLVVPEELNALAVPELEEQFWVRWSQHALLTRKLRGPQNAGRGPILVVCDESSSMDETIDADGNTKEMWSKAFALTLCEQARREGRDFTYIGFCVNIEAEFHFPAGKGPIAQVIDFVEHFGYGGTAFEPALTRALELIQEAGSARKDRPDIVFLTDGEGLLHDSFVEQWRTTLRGLKARCYAIQFGRGVPHETLLRVTEDVMVINQFNANPEGVSRLFRHI